jgi:dTDP-4-amino-4,6-dideoxygalactose transaminase
LAQPIPFIDLQAQRRRLGEPLNKAILAAVESGQWILGPQVAALEAELAKFAGVKHAIACANGTDALQIVLMAWGIGPGDAVFVPAFTFCATAEVVALVGAVPVFVDVREDTYNIDPASFEAAIALVKRGGKLKAKALITVDLFGQPADYDVIEPIAKREGLKVLVDTAQAFGATYRGRSTAAIGDAASTSFFPAKPLGCFGDGGCTFTNDDELARLLKSIHIHGEGTDRYENVRIGMNSRLDSIQAVILSEKLKIFPDEIKAREKVARRYHAALSKSNRIHLQMIIPGVQSVWAQYVIVVPDRAKVQADLKAQGVPTAVYYPIPLSKQKGYAHYPSAPTPVSEKLSTNVVALPMHPYIDEPTQDRVIAAVLESVGTG